MKRSLLKKLFFCTAIISGFGTVLVGRVSAQTFTTLHSFSATVAYTNGAPINADGACPFGKLVISGNTLYGTTFTGGSSGRGTVFKVNIDGTGFRTLYSFSPAAAPVFTNSDGISPNSGLVLLGNTLYGTTVGGGISNAGTVFSLRTDGTGFSSLYAFTGGSDGWNPYAGLAQSSSTLYGTTVNGGSAGDGTLFAINNDGQASRIFIPSATSMELSLGGA